MEVNVYASLMGEPAYVLWCGSRCQKSHHWKQGNSNNTFWTSLIDGPSFIYLKVNYQVKSFYSVKKLDMHIENNSSRWTFGLIKITPCFLKHQVGANVKRAQLSTGYSNYLVDQFLWFIPLYLLSLSVREEVVLIRAQSRVFVRNILCNQTRS